MRQQMFKSQNSKSWKRCTVSHLKNIFSIPMNYCWFNMLLYGRLRNIKSWWQSWSEFISAPQHKLICYNFLLRKMISILTFYRMQMQYYCNVCQRPILRWLLDRRKSLHTKSRKCKFGKSTKIKFISLINLSSKDKI